jgi:NAD(P)-dependent dehydrogenase (short-subunit alcohol dehydrogenase family)
VRVLVIGGSGTIGSRLVPALVNRGHEVVVGGRTSGDVQVDITSAESIARMYERIGAIDSVVVIAASGPLDEFGTLTESALLENMRGKFFGQVNVVLIGQHHLNPGGSFTLTSGIFADQAWPGVTSGAVISGALHSFVLSAAIALPRNLRVNVISPTMVGDSVDAYSDQFPGMQPVTMDELVNDYLDCIDGHDTGRIMRAYG